MTAEKPLVLVVDDTPDMLGFIEALLRRDYRVRAFPSPLQALEELARGEADLLLTDIVMPAMSGMELLTRVRALDPELTVILMSVYATVHQAVEAMRFGAHDYLEKPLEPETTLARVSRAVEHTRLSRRARGLERELARRGAFDGLLGSSPAMQAVFETMGRLRATDVPVLITGETGTGKELVARALHQSGRRSQSPFIAVNCGAIPAELLEAELFGRVRGAYTGAHTSRAGLIEEANRGTLLLDEVGELPLEMQVKLNRILEDGELRRVGDSSVTQVDVRFLAATHRDLAGQVSSGRFREDLYYRMAVCVLELPPLRAREGDLPLLAHAFLKAESAKQGKPLAGFEPEAMAALHRHRWPGNVRELRAAVTRAVVMSAGECIRLADLPETLGRPEPGTPAASPTEGKTLREIQDEAVETATHAYLLDLMRRHAGNVTRASAEAAVERESLHRLLKRHGLRPAEFRGRS